ncbi:hypothetical protein IJH89_02660 [Candidatus Saccharibacteria bacterium]|nr:hypothetical protein [Candidatus Saccharibacteria bacterium]
MKRFLEKVFGGLNFSWPRLVIFSIVMGVYTALVAMLTPDGCSLHDIAVTMEWWVLPAILIIVNSKKPLEAALKTFVFFLISQPLVYLVQVPFSYMGWRLFGYYRFWFLITLLTFPGAFVGWYIKKDKWYSGVVLSVMTVLLALTGVGYAKGLLDNFPNHLLSIIYCFGIIPVFILGILKDKKPRLIAATITLAVSVAYVFAIAFVARPFEVRNNSVFEENDITFVGEPYVSSFTGTGKGNAEFAGTSDYHVLKLSGFSGKRYTFSVSDDESEYEFEYYFDDSLKTVVINLLSRSAIQ